MRKILDKLNNKYDAGTFDSDNRRTVFRRVFVLAVILLMTLGFAPVAFADGESGNCGVDLTWSLKNGILTINGSGEMTDFTEPDMAPWYPHRDEISRVQLPAKLKNVGDLAFFDCTHLSSVVIPDSVERIGKYAFGDCHRLSSVKLSNNLKTIDEGAFTDCYELTAVKLPEGLTSLGLKAFYRCEKITTVTIPSSVEYIEPSAFGYCKSLIRVDVKANVEQLPDWMFYGCESLAVASIPEDVIISDSVFKECDQLNNIIFEEIPREESFSSGSFEVNGDGTITQEDTKVIGGQSSTVSSTLEYTHSQETMNGGTFGGKIDVTIDGSAGWKEATDTVVNALDDLEETLDRAEQTIGNQIPVNVYMTGTEQVDQKFMEAISDYDVQLTIMTENGSQWRIDSSDLKEQNGKGAHNLSYTLTAASREVCEELGTSTAYVLRFNEASQGKAEVIIPLGYSWARFDAALFQRTDDPQAGAEQGYTNGLVCRQMAVVDDRGQAHYYLASVNPKTEYYIAMNVKVEGIDAILPIELLPGYNAETFQPIQYEITGHSSDWNMEIGQVTWILAGVLVFCIVAIGAVMFVINKQRLKAANAPWNQAAQVAAKSEMYEKRGKKISIEKPKLNLKKKKDK